MATSRVQICACTIICIVCLQIGAIVVPFDNTVEKDSELYKLYNTNIYEKMEQKKANN